MKVWSSTYVILPQKNTYLKNNDEGLKIIRAENMNIVGFCLKTNI